jgi:murein DD-endopeptidase MepM/ murein hydrolase activator NlpD
MSLKDKFIGTGSALLLGSSRKSRIISASALFLAVCAFGAAGVAPITPDASDLPVKSIKEVLALPTLAEQIDSLSSTQHQYVSEETIRTGDTLATLLTRLGVDDEAAANFIKSDNTARALLQLRAGKRVQARVNDDGDLLRLTTTVPYGPDNNVKTIEIERVGKTFRAVDEPAKLEKRIEMRAGKIQSSLFATTDSLGIPDNVTMQIVDMFSTNIDFASDLQPGDHFNVVYETLWQNGEYVRPGHVLAAEFYNAGKTYQTVWFDDPSTKNGGGYFAFDGKSLKRAFLKSPLEFSRISSGFAMRVHPISGQWKAHRGVDFAASTGTPVRASGDGVIDFAGTQNGYGNVVMIKHWNNYSTVYGHMSRFAPVARKGAHVSQGEVIGYVGATGWATGPHLHYEFRVRNEPQNPLTIAIPNAQPMAAADMPRFRMVTAEMSHRFTLLNPGAVDLKMAAR